MAEMDEKENVISDEEIAETLMSLRDESMNIPESLHEDETEELRRELMISMLEQAALREKIAEYEQAENERTEKSKAASNTGEKADSKEDDKTKKSEIEAPLIKERTSTAGNAKAVKSDTKIPFSDSLAGQIVGKLVIPMIFLTILITGILFYELFSRIEGEVESELRHTAITFDVMLNELYPGNPSIVRPNEESYAVCIGEHVLNEEDSLLLDSLKEKTEAEYSYLFRNTRILTTLRGENGERLVGSTLASKVADDVLTFGKDAFYKNVNIDGNEYYAFYRPVFGEDGETAGMIAIAKPKAYINSMKLRVAAPFLIILIIIGIIMIVFAIKFSTGIGKIITKVESFTKRVSAGNLSSRMDNAILTRKDEFGAMGRSVVSMQSTLRELIEKDALTTLPNRRFANKQIEIIKNRAAENGTEFTICIGDIDFFKKVNDTYGHDCGDVVLKETALILKKGMIGKGFAARWGGEEFLLVFDSVAEKEAAEVLDSIRLEIEAQVINYEDMTVKRTMSFGAATGDTESDRDTLIKKADDCLYTAKESGRNRVIVSADN